MQWFVGIDWGSQTHAICVVDAAGKKVLEREVKHRGDAVLAFVRELVELAGGDLSTISAAMEAPHGVMVEALLDSGIRTYSINPKQADRFRDRFSSGGAKDDDLDAFVLASSLRTDKRLFRAIEIPSAELLKLRSLSRSHDALTAQVLSLANQIREELVRYYPQMADLGDWHRERWLWELFESAPTPALTAPPDPKANVSGLSVQKVGAILKQHRIRRLEPNAVLEALRATPLPVAHGVAEAASTRIALLLPILRTADLQLRECSKLMSALMESFSNPAKTDEKGTESPEQPHHDAALLLSLPGIGVHNGAVMLTECLSALSHRDYQAMRRQAGVAPVSQRTGGRSKKPLVKWRQACNHRAREAVYHWARVATQFDPRARAHYGELRSRGHNHGRAIRGVADRLLKVLMAVLRSGAPYDAARRLAHQTVALAA